MTADRLFVHLNTSFKMAYLETFRQISAYRKKALSISMCMFTPEYMRPDLKSMWPFRLKFFKCSVPSRFS